MAISVPVRICPCQAKSLTVDLKPPRPSPREWGIRSTWEGLARRARMPRDAPHVPQSALGKGLDLRSHSPVHPVNLVFPLIVAPEPTLRVTCGRGGLRSTFWAQTNCACLLSH